jgi:hypothetical protein
MKTPLRLLFAFSCLVSGAQGRTPLSVRGGWGKKPAAAIENEPVVSNTTVLEQSTGVNLALILAANSGYLNGLCLGGLLGRNQAVAAVTGTYTLR